MKVSFIYSINNFRFTNKLNMKGNALCFIVRVLFNTAPFNRLDLFLLHLDCPKGKDLICPLFVQKAYYMSQTNIYSPYSLPSHTFSYSLLTGVQTGSPLFSPNY